MMETGPGVNSLVKGTLTFKKKEHSLQWTITYPKAQTLALPADPKKPTPEEEATLALYDRYLHPKGFAESSIKNAKGWRVVEIGKEAAGVKLYESVKEGANSTQRYVNGLLNTTVITLPDGRKVGYVFKNYTKQAGMGSVPAEVTTILTEKGKKTYKRLTLKGLSVKK